MQNSPRYGIASVDRALQLLTILGEHDQIRLSELARRLSVAPSTAHRLLETMVHRGFAEQDDVTRAYRAGPTLVQAGVAALHRADLRSWLRPLLQRLAERLDETIHLGELRGPSVHYLDAVESTRALRVVGRTGRSLPAHCTSTGKVLLADLAHEELEELYASGLPPGETASSIVTLEALRRDLVATHRRGWAMNVGESEAGVVSIAVPVRDGNGNAVAAVSCAAPQARLDTAVATDVATMLLAEVGRLGRPAIVW